MRKFATAIVLLFVLSFYTAQGMALAEDQRVYTVREIAEQAKDGWHQSYETARGETVTVDIDVAVPDVAAFPCYYAEDMQPVDGVPTRKNELADFGEAATVNDPGFFRYDWPNHALQRQWQSAAKKNGTYMEPFGEPRALILRYGAFDMDTAYSVNNPSTMRDAEALLTECVQTYFPGAEISIIPHWLHAHIDPGKYERLTAIRDYVKVQDDPDFQGCFFAYFDQLIGGIPVLGYGYQGYADSRSASMKDETRGDLGCVCITQGLRDIGSDELYRSLQLSLVSPTESLADDVPLCGLVDVLKTAEELIRAGQLRRVDSLRLGYVVWLNDKHTYQLMPTWVIEGELFASADADYRTPATILSVTPPEYVNVYINAQTGELINPWKSNKNHAYDAPELLTWR